MAHEDGELILTPAALYVLYALIDAEQEANLMGEDFIGLTEEQIQDRVEAMPLSRREHIWMNYLQAKGMKV